MYVYMHVGKYTQYVRTYVRTIYVASGLKLFVVKFSWDHTELSKRHLNY